MITACEAALVADDPYQYERLSAQQLITTYFNFKNAGDHSDALINEMRKRLRLELSYEDRETLSKTLANEE